MIQEHFIQLSQSKSINYLLYAVSIIIVKQKNKLNKVLSLKFLIIIIVNQDYKEFLKILLEVVNHFYYKAQTLKSSSQNKILLIKLVIKRKKLKNVFQYMIYQNNNNNI